MQIEEWKLIDPDLQTYKVAEDDEEGDECKSDP